MTYKTAVYGLSAPADGDPIWQTAAQLRATVDAIEAALLRGGLTPPGTDFAALAARQVPSEFRSVETGTGATLTANNWTTVPLVTRPLNGAGSSTSDKFTATSAGLYEVQGLVPFAASATVLNRVGVRVTVNALGATDRAGAVVVLPSPGSTLMPAPTVSTDYALRSPVYLLQLVAGDVVRLDAFQQSTATSLIRTGTAAGGVCAQLTVRQLTRTS